MYIGVMAGTMNKPGEPGQAGQTGGGAPSGVFVMNPFLRENYGKIFDHLELHVDTYRQIFVLSEFEASIVRKLHNPDQKTTPAEREATYKRLLPGLSESLQGLSEVDRAAVVGMLSEICINDDESRARGPSVTSVMTGTPSTPQQFGFLYIPERPGVLPESLAERIPLNFAQPIVLPPGKDDRLRDTAAFTIAHEVGHLVINAAMLDHAVMFGLPRFPRSIAEVLKGEISADRFGVVMARQMTEAGIILNPEITQDVIDARRVRSFEMMISNGVVASGASGAETSQFAVAKHSTGFALGTDTAVGAEYARLTGLSAPILKLRDETSMQMFNAALVGSAPPFYQDIMNVVLDIQMNREVKPGPPPMTFEEEYRWTLTTMPEFARLVAEKMQTAPNMPEEARQMARSYMESSDRLSERMQIEAERTSEHKPEQKPEQGPAAATPAAAPRPVLQP